MLEDVKSIVSQKQIACLIFDLDGTLIDSMPTHYVAYKKVLGKYGLDYSEEEFYALAGVPSFKIIAILNKKHGLSLDAHKISEEKQQAYLENIHKIKIIDEVLDVAKYYQGKLKMGIGTGSRGDIVKQVIDKLGLGEYFDIVVTASDVMEHKPHPQTFLDVASYFNIEPSKCLVFEDGEPGIQAAKAANMYCLDVRDYL